MRNVTSAWAIGAAVWMVVAGSEPAAAQWQWESKAGWTDREPPKDIKEAEPPRFLPRYRETPQEAPVGSTAAAYNAVYAVYKADEFRAAASLFHDLAETFGDDPNWAPRALFMRGECLYQAGSFYRAFEAFDTMLTAYPGGRNYRLALQREFEIAYRFLRGRRRRVAGVPILPGSRSALHILGRIREQDPTGPLADDCVAAIADSHYRRDKYEEAQHHYERLLREHSQSPFAPQAMFRIACGQFFRHNGPDYDAGLLRQAQSGFERFVRLYPSAPEAPRARIYLKRVGARMAEATLDRGRFYQKRDHPTAALVYYRRVLEAFPDAPAAAEADRRIRRLAGPGAAGPPKGPEAEPASGPQPEE